MELEKIAEILIYLHAGFGGIALLAGLLSMIAKKGLAIHKKSGLVFFHTMLISAITAMIVAFLPNHESPFLFAVGIFSLYFILTGKRSLRFKHKNPERLKKSWLKLHLGKMLGAYISATTAFVVVNEFFPSFYGWFIPGIVGGFFITYWIRKLNGKKLLPIIPIANRA